MAPLSNESDTARDAAVRKVRSAARQARIVEHWSRTAVQQQADMREIEKAARERVEKSRAKLKALGWLKEKKR